mmetsp:Transcript_28246/g.84504  ORF Transcript_28246/g.84504 Transcript_28246/m.84504 type:complete len:540 (+) Transcript_28246:1106-2725(+)
MNFHQFRKGVNRGGFLKHMARDPGKVAEFDVHPDFDLTKSTKEQYGNPDLTDFVGDFAEYRKKVDLEYHGNYTKERQLWQDTAVNSVVIRTVRQTQPWIVYTCGAMGCGKGFTMSWMSEHGIFPLENIVHIDPDYFKSIMPEWTHYTEAANANPAIQAGSLCHQESGFMQEIAQEASLQASQNIWVDGSLKDGHWFKQVFLDIRKRFPEYRIGIFYIYASEETVRRRVAERERQTGRGVPEEQLQTSLDAPDKSLGLLMPYVDFVARINNDSGQEPNLVAIETIDRTPSFSAIQIRFARTQPVQAEFPKRLSPIFLTRVGNFPQEALKLTPEVVQRLRQYGAGSAIHVDVSTRDLIRGIPDFNVIQAVPPTLTLLLSPAFPVNVDPQTRLLAEIPASAFSFTFCSGIVDIGDYVHASTLHKASPALSVLVHGGYLYFDMNQNFVAATAVQKAPAKSLLHFGKRTELTDEQSARMKAELGDRFRSCTLPHIMAKGCTGYAFVLPGETFGSAVENRYGGFAYCFRKNAPFKDRIFPIVSAI